MTRRSPHTVYLYDNEWAAVKSWAERDRRPAGEWMRFLILDSMQRLASEATATMVAPQYTTTAAQVHRTLPPSLLKHLEATETVRTKRLGYVWLGDKEYIIQNTTMPDPSTLVEKQDENSDYWLVDEQAGLAWCNTITE